MGIQQLRGPYLTQFWPLTHLEWTIYGHFANHLTFVNMSISWLNPTHHCINIFSHIFIDFLSFKPSLGGHWTNVDYLTTSFCTRCCWKPTNQTSWTQFIFLNLIEIQVLIQIHMFSIEIIWLSSSLQWFFICPGIKCYWESVVVGSNASESKLSNIIFAICKYWIWKDHEIESTFLSTKVVVYKKISD